MPSKKKKITKATPSNSFQAAVFDDLLVRFIINLPATELASIERLGFHLEESFWFYDDFWREPQHAGTASCSGLARFAFLKSYCLALFRHAPHVLAPLVGVASEEAFAVAINRYLKYKTAVPVVGAIIIDGTGKDVLLVQGWNAKANQWGFPRGKIDQDEDEASCAAREVFEEIGFDIGPFLQDDAYVELTDGKRIRLYIVEGIPRNSKFYPQTRKEIRDIRWFSIAGIMANQDASVMRIKPFLAKYLQFCKKRLEPRPTGKIQSSVVNYGFPEHSEPSFCTVKRHTCSAFTLSSSLLFNFAHKALPIVRSTAECLQACLEDFRSL